MTSGFSGDCSDIDSALAKLDEMAADYIEVQKHTVYELAEFYAHRGNLDKVHEALSECAAKHVQHLGWAALVSIKALAQSGHRALIPALLPTLPAAHDIKTSVKEAIPRFIAADVADEMPAIFVAANVDMGTYAKYLMNEMVYKAATADQINRAWRSLEAVDVIFDGYFAIYAAGIHSNSPELIEAMLRHMHTNGMDMSDDSYKQLLRLSARHGPDRMLQTIDTMCQAYGFAPQISFVRRVILPLLDCEANPAKALDKLRSTKLPARTSIFAVVQVCLERNDIRSALALASVKLYYLDVDEVIVRPLISAYYSSGDTVAFVRFVRLIRESIAVFDEHRQQRAQRANEPSTSVRCHQAQFVERIVQTVVGDQQTDEPAKVAFLVALRVHGLAISGHFAEQFIAQEVSDNAKIADLIRQLTPSAETAARANAAPRHTFEQCVAAKKLDEALDALRHIEPSELKRAASIKSTHKCMDLMIDRVLKTGSVEFLYASNAYEANKTAQSVPFAFEPLFDEFATKHSGGIVSMPKSLSIKLTRLVNEAVSLHSKSGDHLAAVLAFERCVQMYGIVPLAELLFISLIKHNQMELFRRLYDGYGMRRGSDKAKAALAYAYIHCDMCKRRTDAVAVLDAGEAIFGDRGTLYEAILDVHCSQSNAEKAAALLETCRSDGNCVPTERMLDILAKLPKKG